MTVARGLVRARSDRGRPRGGGARGGRGGAGAPRGGGAGRAWGSGPARAEPGRGGVREPGPRRGKTWKDSPASGQYGYGWRGPRGGSLMRNANSKAVAEGVHTLFRFGAMGAWTDERLV